MKKVLFESPQVADLARRLVLASREPVGVALNAVLDSARHLLLTGGDPVYALPHRVDIERDCFERGGLSGRVAVGLPSEGDSYANGKRNQVAGEGQRI